MTKRRRGAASPRVSVQHPPLPRRTDEEEGARMTIQLVKQPWKEDVKKNGSGLKGCITKEGI